MACGRYWCFNIKHHPIHPQSYKKHLQVESNYMCHNVDHTKYGNKIGTPYTKWITWSAKMCNKNLRGPCDLPQINPSIGFWTLEWLLSLSKKYVHKHIIHSSVLRGFCHCQPRPQWFSTPTLLGSDWLSAGHSICATRQALMDEGLGDSFNSGKQKEFVSGRNWIHPNSY